MNYKPVAIDEPARMSPQARRHNEMRRAIAAKHPQARELAGTSPWTALAIPVLLTLHWGMAWLVGGSNLLWCFAAAFFFGQIVIHSAGALLHETAHKLIFRGARSKLTFDLGLELVLASFGKQLTYQHQHISSHHPFIGNYERDYEHEDICSFHARRVIRARSPATQRLLTGLTLFLHLLPFGFLIEGRILSPLYRHFSRIRDSDAARDLGDTKPEVWETRTFIAVSIAVNVFLFWAFGFLGWLYHNWALSLFLGKCGVTNLGQSLSEHEGDDEVNPTYSDYRLQNLFLFNTGYHNEHHTFANVPWNRLPKLKKLAPDVFNRENTRNYLRLWFDHVREDFSPSRRNTQMNRDLSARCPKIEE
jgi:sphingolipid 4-desaturase/C4-monooxygenase